MGVLAPYNADDNKGPSVVVIEAARHMQVLYRSMLSGAATRALRIYSDPKEAIPAIVADPPDCCWWIGKRRRFRENDS